MNISQLKYAVEVSKTGSITQAAENLFMSQPNLSRAIRELEQSLGFEVFKRTSKGIEPTPRGAEFLVYAESALAQLDKIEAFCLPEKARRRVFAVCATRAAYLSHAFALFAASLGPSSEVLLGYNEADPARVVDNLLAGSASLGVIRCQKAYEDYYHSLLKTRELKAEPLWEFTCLALLSAHGELAEKESVSYSDLSPFIEVAYGDIPSPSPPRAELWKPNPSGFTGSRVLTCGRGSEFELVSRLDGCFMWSPPLPAEILAQNGLILKEYSGSPRVYCDLLVSRRNYAFGDLEEKFIGTIASVTSELAGPA